MKTGDRFKSRQLHIEDYLKVIPAEQGRNSGVLDYRKIEGRGDIFTDFWTKNLLELVIRRDNLNKAYLQVKRNKGAGGIDGMDVSQLLPYLREHQDELIQQIRDGPTNPTQSAGLKYPRRRKAK